MGIADRAATAARERELARQADPRIDPQDKRYVPAGEHWDRLEERASAELAEIVGEDPGPAQRLEPGSYNMRSHAHQYPQQLQRRWLLVFRPEGLEIAASEESPGRVRFYAITRSSNPMEEVMATRVRTVADLGDAVR